MRNLILSSLALLSACATTPTAVDQVQVVRKKDELDERCRVVSKVRFEEGDMREDAVKAGADTIYFPRSKLARPEKPNFLYFLRCRASNRERAHPSPLKAAKNTPSAPTEPGALPRLDAPDFSPEPQEILPEQNLEALPEAVPQGD